MIHNFHSSKKIEINTSYIHDVLYQDLLLSKVDHLFIDRQSCDYNTSSGKKYQQNDIDAIISFKAKGSNDLIQKAVSEKIRTRFFEDIYYEIISVLKVDKLTRGFQIIDIGWGLKANNPGPDYLSVLFLEKEKYRHLFFTNYPNFKNQIISKYEKFARSSFFITWLKNEILKRRGSFSCVPNFGQISSELPINKIIVALNSTKSDFYYTVGLTFDLNIIKNNTKIIDAQGLTKDLLDKTRKQTCIKQLGI